MFPSNEPASQPRLIMWPKQPAYLLPLPERVPLVRWVVDSTCYVANKKELQLGATPATRRQSIKLICPKCTPPRRSRIHLLLLTSKRVAKPNWPGTMPLRRSDCNRFDAISHCALMNECLPGDAVKCQFKLSHSSRRTPLKCFRLAPSIMDAPIATNN